METDVGPSHRVITHSQSVPDYPTAYSDLDPPTPAVDSCMCGIGGSRPHSQSLPCSPSESILSDQFRDGKGLFSKFKRRLSERRRSFFGKRRKSSQDSSYHLDIIFADDVGRRLSNSSRDSLLEAFEVGLLII